MKLLCYRTHLPQSQAEAGPVATAGKHQCPGRCDAGSRAANLDASVIS